MPLFRCNQQGFVKVMLQSVIEKRILTLKNMKKVALSLGAIILSVTGCGYNRECQTSGSNQNNCYKTKRVDPYNIKGNNSVYFIPAYEASGSCRSLYNICDSKCGSRNTTFPCKWFVNGCK